MFENSRFKIVNKDSKELNTLLSFTLLKYIILYHFDGLLILIL